MLTYRDILLSYADTVDAGGDADLDDYGPGARRLLARLLRVVARPPTVADLQAAVAPKGNER